MDSIFGVPTSALVGQVKSQQALDDAQIQVERIMRGG